MAFQRSRTAFTLIELLVVVGIIAILATLLLPTLAQAKKKAAGAACANHLRQLTLAAHLYSHDNSDYLPHNFGGDTGISNAQPNWVGGLMAFETSPGMMPWLTDATNTSLLLGSKYGRIGDYTKAAQIYRCPSDRSWVLISGRRCARVRSYSMNVYTGLGVKDSNGYHVVNSVAEATRPSPENTFYFVDEHEDTIDDGQFIMIMEPSSQFWADLPASRHAGAGALSFLDGHVEAKRWLDSRTRKPFERKYLYNRITTPDNRDITWTEQRATSKVLTP
jgi:prepilin-type N-terminal cleavage/methylation domain-containing protein/prepilin-type processing-associated H-X9-DG protein